MLLLLLLLLSPIHLVTENVTAVVTQKISIIHIVLHDPFYTLPKARLTAKLLSKIDELSLSVF